MRIVILGAGGRLGAALKRNYRNNFDAVGFNRAQLDLAKTDQVRDRLASAEFDILINCAAMTNVDLCESKQAEAFAVNADAPKVLAEICTRKKAKLIHFSTDYVFDGQKSEPYVETDAAKPVSVYGESKRAGEENILALKDRHLVIRVSWVFGPERPSFIDAMIKRAREEEKIAAIADKFSAPTYTSDIATMLTQFFDVDVPDGLLHFSNSGECSWQEYAQHALDCCRARGVPIKAKTVGATKMSGMKDWVARRPVYSVLSTGKYAKLTGAVPRSWRDAVADYIERSYSKK
jgi:dTDP-4-dehydrorhamnose reductase